MTSVLDPLIDIENWRASPRQEVAAFLETKLEKKADRAKPDILVVRSRLKPVDVYSYLRARFGEPNGFLNFLRRDDSDNLIHWDFNLLSWDRRCLFFWDVSRSSHHGARAS